MLSFCFSRFVVFRSKSTSINDAGLSHDFQYGFNHKGRSGEFREELDLAESWEVSFDPEILKLLLTLGKFRFDGKSSNPIF